MIFPERRSQLIWCYLGDVKYALHFIYFDYRCASYFYTDGQTVSQLFLFAVLFLLLYTIGFFQYWEWARNSETIVHRRSLHRACFHICPSVCFSFILGLTWIHLICLRRDAKRRTNSFLRFFQIWFFIAPMYRALRLGLLPRRAISVRSAFVSSDATVNAPNPCIAMAPDTNHIVCYHPEKPHPYENTRPIDRSDPSFIQVSDRYVDQHSIGCA